MDAPDSQPLTPPPAAPGQRKGFLRAVLVLASGTALAHGITAAAMPLLTRLYTPAEFGVLAVFAGSLGIVSVVACLRLEVAIALPADSREALDLLWLSLLICTALSALIGLPALAVPQILAEWLALPALSAYLWLLPVGVLLAGSYSALQFWHVRNKQFSWLAKTRVGQSAGSAGAQLAMGVAGAGPIGLLTGHVMNTGIACLALGGALRGGSPPSLRGMRQLLSRYRRFPLLSAPEALANAAALQVPVILIAAAVAPAEAGYLAMAMFVIQAPMSLIGTAISQVYLSQAPQALREHRLDRFTAEVLAGLWKAGAGPLIALGILAPLLFAPVFGPGWDRAGWLVCWMTPWFLAQFLAVPLSMSLHICGRQRDALMLQVGGFVLRVGMVLAALQWMPDAVAEAYAVSGLLFYAAYLMLVLHVTRTASVAVRAGCRAGLPTALAWTMAASLVVVGWWALERMT